MSLSHEKRMEKQEGKPRPQSIWEQQHLCERQLLLFVPQVPLCWPGSGGTFLRSESRVSSNQSSMPRQTPASWRVRSHQPVWVPARRTPAWGSPGGSSPANSLCMGEIPSATEVIISQQEPTISFHLGTNLNNVRGRGRKGTRCSGAFDKSGQEPKQRENQTSW